MRFRCRLYQPGQITAARQEFEYLSVSTQNDRACYHVTIRRRDPGVKAGIGSAIRPCIQSNFWQLENGFLAPIMVELVQNPGHW